MYSQFVATPPTPTPLDVDRALARTLDDACSVLHHAERTLAASVKAEDRARESADLTRKQATLLGVNLTEALSPDQPNGSALPCNPLAVPDGFTTVEWLAKVSDKIAAAVGLHQACWGTLRRRIHLLYVADRMTETVLVDEIWNKDDGVVRPAVVLPAIDPALCDMSNATRSVAGRPVLNAYGDQGLSRCVGMEHVAAVAKSWLDSPDSYDRGIGDIAGVRETALVLVKAFGPGGTFENATSFDPTPDVRVSRDLGSVSAEENTEAPDGTEAAEPRTARLRDDVTSLVAWVQDLVRTSEVLSRREYPHDSDSCQTVRAWLTQELHAILPVLVIAVAELECTMPELVEPPARVDYPHAHGTNASVTGGVSNPNQRLYY